MRIRILSVHHCWRTAIPCAVLAQAFRVNGHEVLIASGGKFAQKAAEAGLVVTLRWFRFGSGLSPSGHYERK